MKLYIGGAWQGQEELARRENPGMEVLTDLQDRIRSALDAGMSPEEAAASLLAEHGEAALCAEEIGCGVIPLKREERLWREQYGRTLCALAQKAESVTRVFCGLGMKIR